MNLSPSLFKCLCVPSAVISVISVVLFAFVAVPLRAKIAAESDEIQQLHAKIEHSERKIARLPEFEAQFSTVKEDERKIPILLPENRAVDFIEEVERIAKAVGGGVSISKGSVIESAKKKPAPKDAADGDVPKKEPETKAITDGLSWNKRLPLKVEFSGEYAKAVNFLHRIETMSYRLDVISVDVRPIVSEERTRLGSDVFAVAPAEGVDPAVVEPVVQEKPSVLATFDVIVYTE